jgi:acyl carrier protein
MHTKKTDKFDTIMTEFFGEINDPEQTWDEIGMSSTVSVELSDRLNESFSIEVSPDCFELHPTPVALKGAYIEFVRDDDDNGRVCVDVNRLWKAALYFSSYAFITTSVVVLAFCCFWGSFNVQKTYGCWRAALFASYCGCFL